MRAAHRIEHLRILGRCDEAERLARQALDADPGNGLLLFGLATVLHQQGDHEEALRAVDAALADLPQPPVFRQRALTLSALDRHAEAVQACGAALSLDPHDGISHVVHAAVLQRARQLTAAADAARRAVALAPEEPAAHLVMAEVSTELGDRVTARATYLEVLRLDPDNAAARHDLAVLDLAQGRVGTALRGLLDAGALAPGALSPSSGQDATGGLPVLANVRLVFWRLAWYLRLVLLIGFIVVAATGPKGPPDLVASTAARVAAAAVLLTAGLLCWRLLRGLPPSTRSVLAAILRTDRALLTCAALTAAGFALYGVVVVTGYAVLASPVFVLVILLYALTVGANLRNRRRRGRVVGKARHGGRGS